MNRCLCLLSLAVVLAADGGCQTQDHPTLQPTVAMTSAPSPTEPASGPVVYIYGTIRHPGRYPWHEGINLADLIEMAGGLDEFCSGNIKLHHLDKTTDRYQYDQLRSGETPPPKLLAGELVGLPVRIFNPEHRH